LLLSLLVFTANIGGISIFVLDEAKNSVCAREMYERADWVVPTFNYELRTDKPPLHYYFMRVGYALFGINEWGARFFSALMGMLTVMAVYLFAKYYVGKSTAFYASLVLLASLQVVAQFHLAVPDPYLIFFLTLGLLCFYAYYQESRKVFIYAFYACLGLATLAKGPVAVVFMMLFCIRTKASSNIW
jgi:4-amino-4-deoxy-L-arabinose transferase-like glycosyltransferase